MKAYVGNETEKFRETLLGASQESRPAQKPGDEWLLRFNSIKLQ
jgi:hypothetical protein